MSKNVHSEEEWDILSDPEETLEKSIEIEADTDELVINDSKDTKINIKENVENEITHLEIILDKIEDEADQIEKKSNISQDKTNQQINRKTEHKNLISEEDPFCDCLIPYLNTNSFRKHINCIIL